MASTPPSRTRPDGRLPADRALPAAALVAVTTLGWSYLFYQDWAMRHMDLVEMAMPRTEAWGAPDLALVFVMWALMMVAMMVPSVTPTVLLFARINRERRERPSSATGMFLLGYLAAWTAFSGLATLAQWGLHAAALISPMMVGTSQLVGGVLLIGAGAYQLSPLKSACLAHCRSPLSFLLTEWREGAAGAFFMGLKHGAYCTGCCGLLMALLFVVGVMNLYWVAALTAFVVIEKTLPLGPWLGRAGGLLLVGWGTWLAFVA